MVHDVSIALDHLHTHGFIHRDVAPKNIFRTKTCFKLIDFGLATPREGGGLDSESVLAGTIPYMAPEVLTGPDHEVDGRADVYGLASIVYEALTGVAVVEGTRLEDLFHGVLFAKPVPAHELDPSIPTEVGDVIARALAKEPEARPDGGGEFYREFLAGWRIPSARPHRDLLRSHHGPTSPQPTTPHWPRYGHPHGY